MKSGGTLRRRDGVQSVIRAKTVIKIMTIFTGVSGVRSILTSGSQSTNSMDAAAITSTLHERRA